ncbi:MAG: hypothetical protein IIC10_04445 [Proteobacteria bacterium]|nr:hypothetical protein [Pseudomonadota bacterium]
MLSNEPIELLRYMEILAQCLGKTGEKNLLPLQAGDVLATYADVDDRINAVDYQADSPIDVGVARFVE